MRLYQDGVDVYVLPDCAKCTLENKHPFEFEKCPISKCENDNECTGECEYYEENYDEESPYNCRYYNGYDEEDYQWGCSITGEACFHSRCYKSCDFYKEQRGGVAE